MRMTNGRRVLERTSKARRSSLTKTRSAREKVIKSFDVMGTAEILK